VSKKVTRTAKVGGKNIDIPAAMNYTDYKKVYVDKTQTLEQWKNNLNKSVASGKIAKNSIEYEENMNRRKSNLGAFSQLQVPMQKKAIEQTCRKYGVDISNLRFKIQRGEGLLNAFFAGMTAYENVGRIDLTPRAFENEEELIRTVIHERLHVKQLLKYGKEYVQENRAYMERVAERGEDFFYRIVRRRVNQWKNG